MAGETPEKRERTLYEIASSFFAGCVIVFAIAGMIAAALGDEGVVSAGFAICTVFLLLGIGRLYLGWVRGNEGVEPDGDEGGEGPAAHRTAAAATGPRRSTRRPPLRRRRP